MERIKCSKCGEEKPEHHFHRKYRHKQCKPCYNLHRNRKRKGEYIPLTPEEKRKRKEASIERCRARAREYKKEWWKNRTQEQREAVNKYNRERYAKYGGETQGD